MLQMQKKPLLFYMSSSLYNKMKTENFNVFWFSLSIKNENSLLITMHILEDKYIFFLIKSIETREF